MLARQPTIRLCVTNEQFLLRIPRQRPTEADREIREMADGNGAMLKNPFKDILRLVAIMEYDFDNGQDKDEMARRILGEKVYQENKKRISQR